MSDSKMKKPSTVREVTHDWVRENFDLDKHRQQEQQEMEKKMLKKLAKKYPDLV